RDFHVTGVQTCALPIYLLHRGSFHYGYQTQTAGTEIRQLIDPKRGALTRVTQLTYRSDSTAHALSLLRPLAYTVTSADAEASQRSEERRVGKERRTAES